MPDALWASVDLAALPWLLAISTVAGLVYGFAGFGAGLIFIPAATVFVAPEVAIAAFSLSGLASLVTLVPRAWARCDKRITAAMIGAALLALPLGTALLRLADALTIRWAQVGLVALALAALLLGWRRRSADTAAARLGVAAACGVAGGATGLNGPLLVLFQLSGQMPPERMRANTLVFLTVTGCAILPSAALQGLVTREALALGLLLLVPYGLGSRLGQALFSPGRDRLYRGVAYSLIGGSVVVALPIWSH